MAVELATTEPRACWIGVTVAEPAGRLHLLDHGVVHDVLARGTASRPGIGLGDGALRTFSSRRLAWIVDESQAVSAVR